MPEEGIGKLVSGTHPCHAKAQGIGDLAEVVRTEIG